MNYMHLHVIHLAGIVKIYVIASMSDDNKKTAPCSPASATELWVTLAHTQQRVLAAMERDLKAAGLPPLSWYDVLWELDRAEDGRLRPFEIEERTLLTQYNLSRLIDRLEKEALVRREVFDRDCRGRWVVITEAGRERRARMWTIYRRSIEEHLGARLSEEEAQMLTSLLKRLA